MSDLTDPNIEAIQDDEATKGYRLGNKVAIGYLAAILLLILIFTLPDMVNNSHIKPVTSTTKELFNSLLEAANYVFVFIYSLNVGAYVFKGKGGSKFFEAIGGLIDKAANFYKAKAAAKVGLKKDDKL